ncbi:MAG: FAD-dependent oxidoreductase [Lautropia sp.]
MSAALGRSGARSSAATAGEADVDAASTEPPRTVVVIGAGCAGLAAACAAAEAGARVVVLEKLPALAGTTSRSVGSFTAAGTRLQRSARIEDSAEAFAEDIVAAHAQPDDTRPLRELLARHAGETVDWLERIGVVFVGPFPEPPNRVPRMHNAVPAGRVYLRALMDEARRLGVEVRFDAEAIALIREAAAVRGVRYRHRGHAITLSAAAVVLASGDYSASTDLRAAHLSRAAALAIPVNSHSTGDGHRFARDAGAAMKSMDMVFGPQLRFVPPASPAWLESLPNWRWLRRVGAIGLRHAPPALVGLLAKQLLVTHMSPSAALFEAGAILVDATGERVGQDAGPAQDLALRPGATGFLIGDEALAERFRRPPHFVSTAPGIAFAYFNDYERGRPDLVRWADDADALAARLGFEAARLRRATGALRGRVFALGPCQAMLTVTEGGAAIDTQARVLDVAGNAIAGLYAAGGVGQGGLILKGHGLHLAWAMTSGRIAGGSAARSAQQAPLPLRTPLPAAAVAT